MKTVVRLLRLLQISFILARYGLDELLWLFPLFQPLRFLSYLNPCYFGVNRTLSRAQRLRLALEALGPIFVKFGQSLSTRRDFVPSDIADELVKLQNQVPAFPGEQARALIESGLGTSISTVFAAFDLQPLASASIAQVHAATLKTGENIIIKVVRPGIAKQIVRDVDLLYQLAYLTERYWSPGKQLKPREIVAEFEHGLLNELDLMREAASASQLRRNFLNSDLLYIPKVYWEYTRSNILVMERIYGIPIADIPALKRHPIDLPLLAERGVEIFFTQVFRDCFFHADMHPGNIFVSLDHAAPPQYLCVDFGIMGTLSSFDQRYLAENLLALSNRDYRRVVELHVESSWVSKNVRTDEFEAAIRTVCEPIFEQPLREISLGQLLLSLFQTVRHFNVSVQPQLILLQKALFNVEGLVRQLHPDLDLWRTTKPLLDRWVKRQLGVGALLRKIRRYAPYWADRLPEIPNLLYLTLQEQLTHKKPLLATSHLTDQTTYNTGFSHKNLLAGLGIGFLLWALLSWTQRHFILWPPWSLGGFIGVLLIFIAKLWPRSKNNQ